MFFKQTNNSTTTTTKTTNKQNSTNRIEQNSIFDHISYKKYYILIRIYKAKSKNKGFILRQLRLVTDEGFVICM